MSTMAVIGTALLLGAIGLFFSALLKRTQAATVLTYITMLALTLGTTMLFIFWTVVANTSEDGFGFGPPKRAPEQLMYINPGIAMLDVVANTEPGGFGGISSMLRELRGNGGIIGGNVECFGNECRAVDQFGNVIDGAEASTGYWWPRITITFVVLSAILTFAATRLVVPAGMRWAFRRPRPRGAGAGEAPPDPSEPEIAELPAEADR